MEPARASRRISRFWPRSLIAQILLAELGTIAIVALALAALMIWQLNQQVYRYQVASLTEQAQEISNSVVVKGRRLSVRLKPDLALTYASVYDGRAYMITDAAGSVQVRSAFAHVVPWREPPPEPQRQMFRAGAIVGVAQPITLGRSAFWVIVTQDKSGRGAIIDDVARAFLTRYAPVLLLILLLLPLINSLAVRALVRAVRRVSAQAGTIGPKTLDLRLSAAELPLEIAPLARATNAALERLEESFRQQSEFVANVAHELRTPLTALKFQLDAVDDDVTRHRLDASVDRLSHVIAQLQALASLETAVLAFSPFDIVAMAREVVSQLAPQILANGRMIEFEAAIATLTVQANRTLIALALTNLVNNAGKHTPVGTEITVRVDGRGVIEVSDDGPGVAATNPQNSRQRYWRADTHRSDTAGLGLSIVTRILDVHEGELVVESRTGRGARFALVLPAALFDQQRL